MFERFTDEARRVIVCAQEEALQLDHNYIGTEHILLGIMSEGSSIAVRALGALGVELGGTREQIVEIIGRGGGSSSGHIPFTPRAKKVLELSLGEARRLGDDRIRPEHILLGLVREGEGVAAQVLRSREATPDAVRSCVNALRRELPPAPQRDVRLRAMLQAEFVEYLDWVVDDYANELERNRKAVGSAALEASRASFASLLPDGVESAGQTLMIAEEVDAGGRVGVLWFGPSTDDEAMAWIYDITIDPDKRGQGWGRAVMRAFESEARARGYARAGLNVYADNHVARRLYESMGYLETARQLHKELSGEDPLES